MLTFWHWLVHATGCDLGMPYGHFSPAAFWDGIAGSFATGVVLVAATWLRRETKKVSRSAEAAHRIAADLYHHRTGRRHADAPPDITAPPGG